MSLHWSFFKYPRQLIYKYFIPPEFFIPKKHLMKTSALAQIEVESPELKSLIFLPENSDQRKLVLWLRKIKLLSEDLKRKAGLAP